LLRVRDYATHVGVRLASLHTLVVGLAVVGMVVGCGDSDEGSSGKKKPKDAGADVTDASDASDAAPDAPAEAGADAVVDAPQEAATCPSSCSSNDQCQTGCPPVDGGVACCDTKTSLCYSSQTASCPMPPPDSGLPPY
jgi:hypothetical protein